MVREGHKTKGLFKLLPQRSDHQDARDQLSNFRFQGTNKKSSVCFRAGQSYRHLISITETERK